MALEEPDVHTVFSLLRNSLKADKNLRGQAVVTLSRYESRPGFCSRLTDIITAKGALSDDDDVRLSASIYLKQTITRYWGNSSCIFNYEKPNLRYKLLSHLPDENEKVAQMLVIIISEIVCSDYPQEWPDHFSVLAQQIEERDVLTSYRILEVLSHTISTIWEKYLRFEETSSAEIFPRLFDFCWQLWKKDEGIVYWYLKFYKFIEINISVGTQWDLTIERWLFCSSIIQMLIIFEFRSDALSVKVLPVKEVCHAFVGAVQSFVPYYSPFPDHPKLLLIYNICVNLLKCLVEILHSHPTSFHDETVRDPVLEFCLDRITNPGEYELSLPFQQLLIESMVMVKSILKRIQCKSRLSSLPSERVKDLCKILITRYFFLKDDDLEKWSQDPESFYHDTNQDRIAERLRQHAEALYIVLFKSYRQLLGPVVISNLEKATNKRLANEEDSRPERFLREAAYTAVALVYHELELFDKLDFKKLLLVRVMLHTLCEWMASSARPSENVLMLHKYNYRELLKYSLFEEVLYPELQNDHPDMCIVHRKIAFVLKEWAWKAKGDMRKPVFCALSKLLKCADLAVRLAASLPLMYLVGGIDFREEDSMYLLLSYWGLSFKLLEDVRKISSKYIVLVCILTGIIKIGENTQGKSVIIKIGEEIIPFANKLVEAWEVCNDNLALQIKVLRALCCLNEIGIYSPVCNKILLPVLEMLSVSNDPRKFNILKYGLLLWKSTISHTPSIDSELLKLFPYLGGILMNSFYYYPGKGDHAYFLLKVGINIIHFYVYLGGRTFLSEHAQGIRKLLDDIYGKLSDLFEREKEVFAFEGELNSGKLKDKKTSVEEQKDEKSKQKDEKNIGALDDIKERFGYSFSESSTVRVAESELVESLRKLQDFNTRSAGGMHDDGQSFTAAVKELFQTIEREQKVNMVYFI